MSKINLTTMMVGALIVVLTGSARAKTVALWPIEWNEGTLYFDVHCRIDSANDFSVNNLTREDVKVLGTELPPNPSADVPEDFACNYLHYVDSNENQTKIAHYKSEGASRYMATTNDFTVEFFFRMDKLLAGGGWVLLAGYNPDEKTGHDRWGVSLRHHNDGYYRWNIFGDNRTDGDVYSTVHIQDADAEAYFASWHHVAFVFRHDCGDGKNWSGLYVDSELVCEASRPVVTEYPTATHTVDVVMFGGRDSGQRLHGAVDYVRICDEALDSGDFLTAGSGDWHLRKTNRTVGYWPFDSKDGVIDGRSAVGGAPMQMLVNSPHKPNTFNTIHVSPDPRKALVGAYPPNMTMSPAVTVEMPDNGSVRNQMACEDMLKYAGLYDGTVGEGLALSNDFTVEGWFMPERNTAGSAQYLFSSDVASNKSGWGLYLAWEQEFSLRLWAHNGESVLVDNVVISGDQTSDINGWCGTWKHVALTYEAHGGAGGVGKWTLYLDGEKVDSVENSAAIGASYVASPGFTVAGRYGTTQAAFAGCVDQVRVCQSALAPQQFLNATTDAEPAVQVLRYWPLNVQGDVAVDGRDATGQGADLSTPWEEKQLPKAFVESPVISNPDHSVHHTRSVSVTGSVRFYDSRESKAADKRTNASLMTFDKATLDLVNAKRSMTSEYYYRSFKSATDSNWVCLYSYVSSPKSGTGANVWTWRTMFNYNDSKKFYFQDKVWCNTTTDLTLGDTLMSYDGLWHHVAIVRKLMESGFDYTFYHDGQNVGTSSVSFSKESPDTAQVLIIGGRWSSNNASLNGALSSLRVSEGALDPAEFLNAAPSASSPVPATVFHVRRTVAPFRMLNVGTWASPAGAFTLEAKVALPETVSDDVEVLGVHDEHPTQPLKWCGWRLSLQKGGMMCLKGSCGSKYGYYVSNAFPTGVASKLGRTVRLAMTYDPDEGAGTWRLYCDGELLGALANAYNPSGAYSVTTGFATLPLPVVVGNDLSDSVRDIRQTRGVLPVDQFLKDRGAVLVVR